MAYKKSWKIFSHSVDKLIAFCGGCLVCVTEVNENTAPYVKALLNAHVKVLKQKAN